MDRFHRTEFVSKSSSHRYASMALGNSAPIDDIDAAAASFERLARGEAPGANPIYARLHNETVSRFEEAMASVEGMESAVAFSSGMASVTAVMMAASCGKSNVVAIRPLYGGTDHLLCDGLCGLEVRWAEAEEVQEVVDDQTALVLAETPANPTLDLVDLEALVEAAGSVPVVIDNTFATPVLQNPADFGVDLVLHSASKYIGGHGDVIGGVVVCGEEWAKRLRRIRIATGGLMHPMAAYLLRRGLSTLPVRMEACQDTAMQLVLRLLEHPAVGKVYYPGLGDESATDLVSRQMKGPGAMVSFEVEDFDAARSVMEEVELITPAVSLGSTDSLIQHPASLTHRLVDEEVRDQCGVSQRLLRMSVGLEHVEDLWGDLERALGSRRQSGRSQSREPWVERISRVSGS